jgi:hypothetical protein
MSGREAIILPAPKAGREVDEMVKVSIEVHSGAARFRIGVRARSIREALSMVEGRHPRRTCRVKFPIEPDGFFVEGPTARAEIVEQPKKMAA